MTETRIPLSVLDLIAGTRAALGAGIGLLVADRLSKRQRRTVGWTLLLIGVLSTGPLLFEVLGHRRPSAPPQKGSGERAGPRPKGTVLFTRFSLGPMRPRLHSRLLSRPARPR
jgi:hypothetical protein